MKNQMRAALASVALLGGTFGVVGDASAAVDRVCVVSGSAAASYVYAVQSNGSTNNVRPGGCSSSTYDLSTFRPVPVPCYSPWGYRYNAGTTYSASALSGDLNLNCH